MSDLKTPPAPSKELIYLSRDGQVYGPITASALERMRELGQLAQYPWIWDAAGARWLPTVPAPAGGPATGSTPAPAAPASGKPAVTPVPASARVAAAPPAAPVAEQLERLARSGGEIFGICHDGRSFVGGKVLRASASGCVLDAGEAGEAPGFAVGQKPRLNLLDEARGISVNADVVVEAVARQGGRWEIRLQWSGLPAMLGHA